VAQNLTVTDSAGRQVELATAVNASLDFITRTDLYWFLLVLFNADNVTQVPTQAEPRL
jgi:hypothetical protein